MDGGGSPGRGLRRPRARRPKKERPTGLGRCRAAFWLALLFDGAGFAALLAGVFADLFFADLLIYGGGVGIFFSLLWWVFWYVGNLEVPPAELQDDVGLGGGGRGGGKAGRGGRSGLARRLARSLSARFSGPFARLPRAGGRRPDAKPDAKPPGGGGGGGGHNDDRRAAAMAATPEELEREGGDVVEGCL